LSGIFLLILWFILLLWTEGLFEWCSGVNDLYGYLMYWLTSNGLFFLKKKKIKKKNKNKKKNIKLKNKNKIIKK